MADDDGVSAASEASSRPDVEQHSLATGDQADPDASLPSAHPQLSDWNISTTRSTESTDDEDEDDEHDDDNDVFRSFL